MRKLYLVFNVVKLTIISKDLIFERCSDPLSNPIFIDSQEEWKVKKILNSYYSPESTYQYIDMLVSL